MISILPQCAKLFVNTASTVERTRTSQRRARYGESEGCELGGGDVAGVENEEREDAGCKFAILSTVSSNVLPTAVTRSLWARAALTTERPMWPVAPKTTHTRCSGGFCEPGGLQERGSCSLELEEAEEGESSGVEGELAAIV